MPNYLLKRKVQAFNIAVCIVLNLDDIFCVSKSSLCEYVTMSEGKFIYSLGCKCRIRFLSAAGTVILV